MSERSNEFIVWISSVCICGGVIAGFLHSIEWLFIPVVIVTAGSFALLLASGYPRARYMAQIQTERRRERFQRRPALNVGTKWRFTTNGLDAGQAMTSLSKAPPLPGAHLVPGDEKWCSFKLGIEISSQPVDNSISTSNLRESFIAFLGQCPFSQFVSRDSDVNDNLVWMNYSSNGRISNAAVLVRDDDQTLNYFAWSLLSLRDDQRLSDPYFAELIVQVELRMKDGTVGAPLNFSSWHDLLKKSIQLVANFGEFLRRDAGVSTFSWPVAQLGIKFSAPVELSQMFETAGLKSIPGSPRMSQFSGYFVADDGGDSPSDVVWESLRSIADHALFLNDYESQFERFRGTSESK